MENELNNEIENDKFLPNFFNPRELLSVAFHIDVIDVPLLKTKSIVCIVKHANYCSYNKGITGGPYSSIYCSRICIVHRSSWIPSKFLSCSHVITVFYSSSSYEDESLSSQNLFS